MSGKIKLMVLAGARPNFMKVAPLLRELAQDPEFSIVFVHTGQHFDDIMSGQFFRDLEIQDPDFHLGAGGGTHSQQTAEIMKRLEPVVLECAPHGMVVVGDVNSTVAGALVAKKTRVDLIHIEAGLRSFDREMPEEINRIVTDGISDLLLITEESGRKNLLHEGVAKEKIHMVGNLMIDSLKRNLEKARQLDPGKALGITPGSRYGLITLHRPSNVDDEKQLAEILRTLEVISTDVPLYWPVHPRTRQRLKSGSYSVPPTIHFLDPLGYLDFLNLQMHAAVVLTDSGGIQEETTVLGVPCLTIRENTERPVTLDIGTNYLAGVSRETVLAAWEQLKHSPKIGQIPPLWDGKAAERCHTALRDYFHNKPAGKGLTQG